MKESKYKLKLVCGFRKDQEFTINANEAHKAYYLFANPDKKMIFNDGLALRGSDIQRIEPDYNAIMGWNPSNTLNADDHNQLRTEGVQQKMQGIMSGAKEIARQGQMEDFQKPLIDLREKYLSITDRTWSDFAQKVLGNTVDKK